MNTNKTDNKTTNKTKFSQAKNKKNTASVSKVQGDVWILEDVLAGKTVEQIMVELKQKVSDFKAIRNKLNNNISDDDFKKGVLMKEDLKRLCASIMHYYNLKFFENNADSQTLAKLTTMGQLVTEVSNDTMFFVLWYMKVDDKTADRLMNIKSLEKYKHYLENVRMVSKYTKSEEVEQIINLKDLTGNEALVTLYNIITNGFVFDFNGKKMNQEEVRSYCKDKNPVLRKKAYDTLLTKFGENSVTLNEIYKNIMLSWYNDGIKIRGYKNPISIRNMGNDVDDAAVQALLSVVRKNANIFAEYFELKHKLNAKNKDKYEFSRYHLYAPYDAGIKENYDYAWSKDYVLETFKDFDQRFYDKAKKIFDSKHVHSHPKANKRGGAFCECSSTTNPPYVLLNHTGRLNDVFTIAHELGHAIHYSFSQSQTELTFDSPLPLAETASVFAEMLLSQRMMKESKSDKEKIMILMHMLDNQYATISRQSFFVIFEQYAHDKIKDSVTKEMLDEYYLKLLKEQFAPMQIPDIFKHEWNYIPHIHETPFYCYAYSWGNLMVLALYDMYRKQGRQFVNKYVEMLTYGSAKNPKDILAELGIDPKDEKFWQRGFEIIKEEIEELKRLAK